MADAVVEYVRDLKLAARCTISRGIGGCYENGEMTTGRLEILSYNLPLHIEIVLPAAACEQVLDGLDVLICDGIITVRDLMVVSHKTATTFFPRQLTVRDVMTRNPLSVTREQDLATAAELLLSSIFTGLPVVDEAGHPLGILTQGDLINRGGLPLRLGILVNTEENDRATVMTALKEKQVHEVMSEPAVCIDDDQPLTEAVELMLEKRLKRLPVVNSQEYFGRHSLTIGYFHHSDARGTGLEIFSQPEHHGEQSPYRARYSSSGYQNRYSRDFP